MSAINPKCLTVDCPNTVNPDKSMILCEHCLKLARGDGAERVYYPKKK